MSFAAMVIHALSAKNCGAWSQPCVCTYPIWRVASVIFNISSFFSQQTKTKFGFIHFFIVITIFFGAKIGESNLNDVISHMAVFWILIAFVGFHVIVEILLSLNKCVSEVVSKSKYNDIYFYYVYFRILKVNIKL